MPDFERLTDKLAEERAAIVGFNEGKTYARMQLSRLFIGAAIGWILGSEFLWPWVDSLK